ncbi:hypothetical protein F8M41_019847 [Gigaspora margarita]|uniref:Uncharacterized protein n=1 Tax=Gigaspora margarita TaxID=4874 RepID=A0A8H3WTH8_GIGMA|nr:hypothetical protein F8M41_019847 [Gigaspora margarita]
MLCNKFGTKNDKNNKFFSLRQRFSYNTSKSLIQDSLESSTIQLDPSTVYSSDEPMEYYKESNECSFEEDNISYYNETSIYSSEELDDD